MLRSLVLFLTAGAVVAAAVASISSSGCSGAASVADMGPDLARDPNCKPFETKPECRPADLPVKPMTGSRQFVMSSLSIADFKEGFDLNCDGRIDNKLSPIGALANPAIKESFTIKHDIVLPIEFFGYDGTGNSACTKFAFYLGRVIEDRDGDKHDTNFQASKADCDDLDPAVHPGTAEVPGNRIDDDCDRYADNDSPGTPGADTGDLDGDGVSIAQGDCDDRDGAALAAAKARRPGAAEVCGNGLDEDCSGIADDGKECDPFGGKTPPNTHIQALSFQNAPIPWPDGGVPADGLKPYIIFPDATVSNGALKAGPDLFQIDLTIDDFTLRLTLSGANVRMKLVDSGGRTEIAEGVLGGVLEAVSLAQIHIDAGGVLKKEQSLLDGIFVGPAGTILGLDTDADGHMLPDIDVDGDGLETFWQEDTTPVPDAGILPPHIDTCRDGDGTLVHNNWDGKGTPCALATDARGQYRFVDGLSAALKFTAVPAKFVDIVEK